MHAIWYAILGAMLVAYVVLDGFDFGAGVVHLFVAKTDEERRAVLGAIGPLWDGNEVWLIASGGVLVFAFPRAYAAAFSGLYLALTVVLWLLLLRGIAIEFRSQSDNPLWRAAWDATFAGASSVMAIVLGVALGNIVRGVPIDGSGYFQEDLFAGRGGAHVGAIDPFTAAFGLFAFAALGAHGATFLAWKTEGELNARCRTAGRRLWLAALALGAVVTASIAIGEAHFFDRFTARPVLWALPAGALVAAGTAYRSLSGGRELRAFLASSAFIALMLVATAGSLYPTLLRSTVDDAFTLDAYNAASQRASLEVGLAVLAPALVLVTGYFVYLFHTFRGKTDGGHHE